MALEIAEASPTTTGKDRRLGSGPPTAARDRRLGSDDGGQGTRLHAGVTPSGGMAPLPRARAAASRAKGAGGGAETSGPPLGAGGRDAPRRPGGKPPGRALT